MNVSFSLLLGLTLMMSSCCGSHEEELTTEFDNYLSEVTMTPDYDYNATFDYYYVTEVYSSEVKNKAAEIGPLSLALLLGLAVHQI